MGHAISYTPGTVGVLTNKNHIKLYISRYYIVTSYACRTKFIQKIHYQTLNSAEI